MHSSEHLVCLFIHWVCNWSRVT